MKKKKPIFISEDEDEDLEKIEEDLTEEFIKQENKKPMPVHSAGLKSIHKEKDQQKMEGNDNN